MQPIPLTSQLFQPDQRPTFVVESWDTPFSPLESDVASGGIIMDLREPRADGVFTLRAQLDAATPSNALSTFTNDSFSKSVVSNGRVANLVGYWAGGAPGQHGSTVKGRVAYHWKCVLRSPVGRGWFSGEISPPFSLAFAGNGYFRIVKIVGGTPTDLFKGEVLENDFLEAGFKFTPVISDMSEGDYLDIYYIQDVNENVLWGGYVFKVISENLVSNFSLEDGTNTNFPGFTVLEPGTPTPPEGTWVARDSTLFSSRQTSELMPVNPDQDFTVESWVRWVSGVTQPRHYIGVAPYDVKGVPILSRHVNTIVNTETTLAQAVNPTDTEIVLTDATNWIASVNHRIAFDIEDDGSDLPNRNETNPLRSIDSIVGNTLTLSGAAGVAWPAGTKVREHREGGTYMYAAASNQLTPSTWTKYTGVISGQQVLGELSPTNKFWFGTRFVKMVWLLNRDTGVDAVTTDVDATVFNTNDNVKQQEAPVLGCGLFDDGSPPPKRTFTMVERIDTTHRVGSSTVASVSVPLIKPDVSDKIGWEWVRLDPEDPGILRHQGDTIFDVKRQRLIRVKGGFENETYTLFTGFIDDWDADDSGIATIKCMGFEQRLLDQFIKNYPDKIGYMSFRFIKRRGVVEPVYEVPAYDNWPLEYVLRDLSVRAGLDESRVFKDLTVPKSDGSVETVVLDGKTYNKFRARSMSGKKLRLERPVHYGNVGAVFTELRPADDEYLFKPENTREIWNRCRELADRYGYDFRFDEFGDAVLQGRNNPHFVQDIEIGGTEKTNPSAHAGTYREFVGAVATRTYSVTGSRIDLSVPRGPLYGAWSFTVKLAFDGSVVASGTLDPSTGTGGAEEFFYDFRAAVDGTNSTIATLFSGNFDDYNVELTSSGGDGTTIRRLDCFLVYHTDPSFPRYSQAFSTAQNALKVSARPTMDDMRNQVIVVGRRVASVTDSDKLQTNPNNPESEFVVERAVDVGSIVDPAALNYIGFPKESIIFDSSILDRDMAAYLARVFIFRQRMPKPIATLDHTLAPVVQLRDPIFAVEEGFKTIDAQTVLYVTEVRHRFERDRAVTSLDTTSYPEFPAFEPREDIDIDEHFGGNPIVNAKVEYTSLTGEVRKNLPLGGAGHFPVWLSGEGDYQEYSEVPIQSGEFGSPKFLDLSASSFSWPPVPGTVQLRLATGTGIVGTQQTYMEEAELEYNVGGSVIGGRKIRPGDRFGPIGLPNFKTVDSVKVTALNMGTSITIMVPSLQFDANGNPIYVRQNLEDGSIEIVDDPSWHYEIDDINETISVYYDKAVTLGPTGFGFVTVVDEWALEVKWTPYADGKRGGWLADNPYHHYTNVDYRDSDRRIYLPWHEGDGSTAYQGLTGTTSLDVRYRRLGPVDVSGNFSDPYGGFSPFYDPYTSELGYLISFSFDALVSGLYRISVRNVHDDTVVAWLTEPTAEPDNEETHWQYFSAGSAKELFWDGVDHVGAWNRKQSEDYATGAHGAFEQDERPIIGRKFYVWNEERRSGAFGPLAVIAGDRDATTGKPIFGVGTFGSWYVKVEVTNDVLEAIAEANAGVITLVDSKKTVPRQVSTAKLDTAFNTACIQETGTSSGTNTTTTLNDTSKVWTKNQWRGYQVRITSGTGIDQVRTVVSNTSTQLSVTKWATTPDATSQYQVESPAAIIYTHIPEPTHVGLEIADWQPTVSFDETNQASIDDSVNWSSSPDEKGTSTGSNTTNTLHDTGKSWLTDMWKGHEVIVKVAGVEHRRRIVSNTATVLTVTPIWTTTPALGDEYRILSLAKINNQKPVRVRFGVMPRPGVLWSGKQDEVSILLTRCAHLKASIFDQFAIFKGQNYPTTSFENRRVVSRRLMNDTHTIKFKDAGYRKAKSFKSDTLPGLEWVFLPKHFRKNFRGVENESIKFGDYLQLEEVPFWNPNKPIAGERSRFMISFINYLFYLSAYTQDRSGRMSWCLNQSFLDKTKIIKNRYSDWWPPDTPNTAATEETYRNSWPESMRSHRRTIVVRQWTDEGAGPAGPAADQGWRHDERTTWGFVKYTSLGDKFLRHMWKDHDPVGNTLLVHTGWPGLDQDEYSHWHRDGRTQLPSAYSNLTRQLGSVAGGSRLSPWTWEGEDEKTIWIPCISRDFHPFYMLPPTVEKVPYREGSPKSHIYISNDPNRYNPTGTIENTGDDAAAGEPGIWNSPVWDVTQAYSSASSGKKRFWQGTVVDPDKAPTKPIEENTFDYQRQDDMMHYEDFRGIFSRGARPAEPPRKVVPVVPYYVNLWSYGQIDTLPARKAEQYPFYRAEVTNWFDVKFRSELLWESAELFPSNDAGGEILGAMNIELLRPRRATTSLESVRFDGGAWSGWKDDIITTGEVDVNYKLHTNSPYIFSRLPATGLVAGQIVRRYMPVATGPQLEVTMDMLFHMVLVNERRNEPL